MVATIGRMAFDSYYLEAQRTWRPGAGEGATGGLFAGGGTDRGMRQPGGEASTTGVGTSATSGEGGATGYYVESGEEPDGTWWNPDGLFGLADGGAVDARDFRRLYHGFDPLSGEALVRNPGSEKRSPGLDITFSADKSVSALWAIAGEGLRDEIARAHNDACRVALEEIIRQHCNWTRIRPKGGDIELLRAKVAGAMFQHGTSRENDPQLHTHCLVFNLSLAEDGKVRSHHQAPIFRWKKAMGATYRNALAWNLQQRLGIAMERYGKEGEFTCVAGMPEALLAEWSKRRRTIEGMAAGMGFATGANAAAAAGLNKATRDAKIAGQGGELRHVAWDLEAAAHIEDRQEFVAGLTGQEVAATVEEIAETTARLDRIPEDITAHEAVFRLPDIVEKAMNATAGVLGPAASRASVERVLGNEEVVELDMPPASIEVNYGLAHTRVFSTRTEIDMEADLKRMALEASLDPRLALDAGDIEIKIAELRYEERPLSEEQEKAIHHGAGAGGGRLAIIEGAAGAGKTTTLRPIVDLYAERGSNVIATAVAWRTAVALGNDCGVTPYSVDRLLRRVAKGDVELDDTTVIVVDEAGMLSTRQAWHILRLADEHGCKVILAGDTEQHQPIGAGPGLRLMREAAGGVRVDEIRRQKVDAEDVLTHIDGLDPETARLQAGLMGAGERRETVARYEALADKPDVASWQIAVSEAIRDGKADVAIEALQVRDRLHVEKDLETTLNRLVDDWEAWRRDNPTSVATVIARTHDEVGALSHIMRERVLGAAGGEDERVVVEACGARSDDDRTRPLEIARGDLLRIGTLVWEKGLYNGTIVEVAGITVHGEGTEDERVEISGRTEYGGDVSFFVDEVTDIFGRIRLDHGYAMTVASSQGRTVDAAFVLADDRAARPTIYPALTRHREHLEVYVNREPLALAVASRRPEDEQGDPVSDADIAEHLAGAWSRDGYKVAAHDFMSGRLADQVEATYPGGKGAPAWLAANDNKLGTLKGVGRAIRNATDRWRYGRAVAGLGDEMRELDDAYDELTEMWVAQGGGDAELVGEFRAHAGLQRDLAARMAPFVAWPGRYEALWRDAGGVALQDVLDFRAGVEDLDAWVRRAGRIIQESPAGDAVDNADRLQAEGGDMALASESSGPADTLRLRAVVEACAAQAADPFRWLVEGEAHLADLHARAEGALADWPDDGPEGRASVERFVSDWPAASRAWAAARRLVADLDEARGAESADRAAGVLRTIEAIESDAGALWHDETMRIVQRGLARRGTLVRADAWLVAAKADLAALAAQPAEEKETISAPPRATATAQPETRQPERRQPARRPAAPRAGTERTPLPTAGEVADELAMRAEEVCRRYLPAGRLESGQWLVGDVQGTPGKSTKVNLHGPRAGRWRDWATNEHGNLLDLIRLSQGLPGTREALQEARRFLGGSVTAAPAPAVAASRSDRQDAIDEEGRKMRRMAARNWADSGDVRSEDSTPAVRYLLGRGLDPVHAAGLRWHPAARTWVDGELREYPAVVARIETHDGRFEGIQRIFVDEEGHKVALRGGAKRGLGPQEEGGVWFGNRNASRVAMTEGFEDALAAVQALPPGALDDLCIVATVGGGRVAQVTLPPQARELVLLQDAGEGGDKAWTALQERYAASEVRLSRIPMVKDVNDDLEADAAGLAQRLSPLAAAASAVVDEATDADIEGRVAMWRASAADGGWAAADIEAMTEDLDRVRAALAGWPAERVGDDGHRALEAFSADAGSAIEAMRLARVVPAGVIDLWRQRREVLDGLARGGAGEAGGAQRLFVEPPDAWQRWTDRAGRALEVLARLEAVDGTAWEDAVTGEVAHQVMRLPAAVRMTEDVGDEETRARFFLLQAAREIGEVLESDDSMRQAIGGDAEEARMTRGGGFGYSQD